MSGAWMRLEHLAEGAAVTYKHTENVIVRGRGDVMKDKPSKPDKIRKKSSPSPAVRMKPGHVEEFVANVDELDFLAAPPRPGKMHPRQAMADVVPTTDDGVRRAHYHPSESAAVEFESDPDAADAAADLASDLGADFLEAATRGRDLSDVFLEHEQEELNEFILGEEEPGRPPPQTPSAPLRPKATERSTRSGRAARSRSR